jgi:hypothetical protein
MKGGPIDEHIETTLKQLGPLLAPVPPETHPPHSGAARRVDVRLGDVGDEAAAAVGAEGQGLEVVVHHAEVLHVGRLLQVEITGEPFQLHHSVGVLGELQEGELP